MTSPTFVITIDTEGDNLWAHPAEMTTHNARHLPRFQQLCDRFGFAPTYLVNYEMAVDPHFQEFGRAVVAQGTAEIGLHIHPWYSPPSTVPYDPDRPHHYLYEQPDAVISAQVDAMTELLADAFGTRPRSHRAGRWGFDVRVARVLLDRGYLVDCSVTPGISWRRTMGDPEGHGGPDYRRFPLRPYFLDLADISRPGATMLLEIPVTIRSNDHPFARRVQAWGADRAAGRLLRRVYGAPHVWLRPNGRNLTAMLDLVAWVAREQLPVAQFMLHSSELMPGGSPTFRTPQQIEALYDHLHTLFTRLAGLGFTGMTLSAFRMIWQCGTETGASTAESVHAL